MKHNVTNVIKNIKIRPLMYVEKEELGYIIQFINGYVYHSNIIDEENEINNKYQLEFHFWLAEWIKRNRNNLYEFHTYHISKMIYEITDSEEEAVELFYQLTDEFFAEMERENNK